MCHWTKCFMSAHVYIRSPSGFGPQYRFSVRELRIGRTILWDSSFYTIFSAKTHKPDFWKHSLSGKESAQSQSMTSGNQTRPLWWYVSCKRHEDLVHGIGYAGPRGFPSPRREKREREAARESLFWIWSARAHIPRLLFDLKSHQALEGSWVINNMAEDFVGAKLRITTSDGSYIGIVHSIDTKKRKLTLTKGQNLLVTRLNWCVLNCWIGTFV